MVYDVLCQKGPSKDNAVGNYCPITYVITGKMYDYLEQEKLLPENKKDGDKEAI